MAGLGNAFVTITAKGLDKIQKHQEKLIKNAKTINRLLVESHILLDKIDATKTKTIFGKLELEDKK